MSNIGNQAKGIFSQLPVWAKGVIAVAVVGGALYGGYKFVKWWQNYQAGGGRRDENKQNKSDLDAAQKKGQKPSYSDSQYSQWSNQLRESFDGCGTSNGTVVTIFGKLRNDVDFLKLKQAYGTRKFDECNWEGNFGDFEGTLPEALVHELSDNELKNLNSLLQKAGITYSV